MDAAQRTAASDSSTVYDGFISYSHAADDLLAPRLQSGLQRFAKPWWKRRALRIFRDESSLSANPHLWSSITEALDSSGWFVLLLSPDAADSPWVNQEVEYWKEHKDAVRILPVLTDGTFEWAEGDVVGTSVPEQLQGAFTEEPRWVDLRFARDETDLDLKDPRFADAVADIASALRGIPKDELASEEVRQHRRTIRTAWTAGVLVLFLGIAAAFAAIQAFQNAEEARQLAEAEATARSEADANAEEAETQRKQAEANAEAEQEARSESDRQAQLALARELSASAVNVLVEDPELAILLTLEAIRQTPEGVDQPAEVINALWQAVREDRLVSVIDTGSDEPVEIALSGDASLLAAITGPQTLSMLDTETHEVLWSYTEDTIHAFSLPFISPDGEMVAVGVRGAAADHPARVVVLDAINGSLVTTVEFPACPGAYTQGWSPQGTYFAVVSHSHEGPCFRPDGSEGGWVAVLDGETLDQVALIETIEASAPFVSFDRSENLYVFGVEDLKGLEIYPAPQFTLDRVVDQIIGFGSVSMDGSRAVSWSFGGSDGLNVANIETGERTDLLRPSPSPPGTSGPQFSAEGTRIVMSTIGDNTSVWDVGTGEQIFDVVGGPAANAAMSTDGKWLYTGHIDGTIKLWTLEPAGGLETVDDLGSYGHINSNVFRRGSDLVAASAFDISNFVGAMVFFDRATGEFVGEPVDAWSPVFAAALADDRFALRNQEGVWVVLDPRTGSEIEFAGCPTEDGQTCTDSGEPVPRIDVLASTNGTELAFSLNSSPSAEQLYDGAPFSLVDPDDGSVIGPLAPGIDLDVQVFSDEWLLGWSEEHASHIVVDRTTNEELALELPQLQRWEVSENGGKLAILELGGTRLTIVDTNTWETSTVGFELGNPRGLAFSPDEKWIALGDENGLHIARIESGVVEQSIPLPSVSDIHWFDSENVLVGGSGLGGSDGLWARVPLKISDLVSRAIGNLARGFTDDECETYRISPCPTLDEIRSR